MQKGTHETPPAPTPGPASPSPMDGPPNGYVPEQTHRVLEGKYKAETRALRNDVADQKSLNDQLNAENEALKQEVQALREANSAPIDPDNPYGLPEELSEMPEVVEIAEAVNQKSQQEIDRLKAGLEEMQNKANKDAEDRFWNEVDAAIPDWQALNAEDGFLDWLEEHVQEYGDTRASLLQRARNTRNVAQTKAIFDSYRTLKHGQAPVTPSIASQITPTPQATVGPGHSAEIIPSTEADAIYNKIISGQIPPHEKEAQLKRLNAAMAEGRIDYER